MKLKRIDNTGVWEISCTSEEIPQVADILHAAAHERVGMRKNDKPFTLRLNGKEIETSTNVELWMFARGLEIAWAQKDASKVRVEVEKEEGKEALTAWDEAFEATKETKKDNSQGTK